MWRGSLRPRYVSRMPRRGGKPWGEKIGLKSVVRLLGRSSPPPKQKLSFCFSEANGAKRHTPHHRHRAEDGGDRNDFGTRELIKFLLLPGC